MQLDIPRLGFMLILLAAPVFSQDPYKLAPDNYRIEFENEWARISRASLRPSDKIAVHDHPPAPTVYVYLTDGGPVRFTHIKPKFSIERPAVKAGGIRINRVNEPETHEVEYLGSSPSEYLRVELKPKSVALPRRTSRLAPEEAGPFETDQIRIRRVTCANASACVAEYPSVVVSVDKRAAQWVDARKSFGADGAATHALILIEFKTAP